MMKEEIAKVLEMVQAGTVTAEEGQQLLQAMGAYDEPKTLSANGKRARKLYMKVASGDGNKVDIALPLSMVKTGVALGMGIANKNAGNALEEKGIDLNEILRLVDEMAASGEDGDIVNVSTPDGNVVHIFME